MSSLPYFIWNGVRSDTMGVIVSSYPAITRPKERVSQVTIPGRSGDLTIAQGACPVYESYLRTCECYIRPSADLNAIMAWLKGAGTVIFGNEPNRLYEARIINQIDFEQIMRGRAFRSFNIPFQCQPYKYLYPAANSFTVNSSGTTITNPGSVEAEPILLVSITGSGTLTLGGGAISITSDWRVRIDVKKRLVTNADMTSNWNYRVSGDLPTIPPGDSLVSFTDGISAVVITPQWRYI